MVTEPLLGISMPVHGLFPSTAKAFGKSRTTIATNAGRFLVVICMALLRDNRF